MNEIIEINSKKIDGSLPILVLNKSMEDIEKEVLVELEKPEYNSIVVMDNFKQMKESSQFLGKVAKQISDFRILKVKEESQDIKLFEDSLKKFTNMFKEKQDIIKSGLDIFEEQTRQKVLQVCKDYFEEFSLQVGLRPEFKNINLDDMTQTGYATATFKISKKGIDEVERRVNIQLTLQTKVDNRLLNLENECLKVGIEPLTEQHIKGFLFASDEEYQKQLKELIYHEMKRNEAIKQRVAEQAEKDAKEKVLNEQKALKDELEARYSSRIETATIEQLIMINLELKSYDDNATYELKQLAEKRQLEIENDNKIVIDESPQEEHLKAIMEEKVIIITPPMTNNSEFERLYNQNKKDETIWNENSIIIGDKVVKEDLSSIGQIRKFVTVTFEVIVPVSYEHKVQSIYEKRFEENIKNVENLKVSIQ